MLNKPALPAWIAAALLALALALMLKSDLAQAKRAAALSLEGSPAPAHDPASPTGYALGQRHYLGTHERGETWRWIAATQQALADGLFQAAPYTADNVPEGRPQLAPRLYTAWLATLARVLAFFTGEPAALAVERAARWDALVAHLAGFAVLVAFMARRHGAIAAGIAGLFFALFPPVAGQFLPGVLTPRPWAMLFASAALASCLPRTREDRAGPGAGGALAAGIALWLDPAFGFPVVLITATVGAFASVPRPFLRWAVVGAAVVSVAWLADRSPWDPTAGELRYVHPLYALAWLGLGLALDAGQRLKAKSGSRRTPFQLAAAVVLVAPLVWIQLEHGFKGWLYSGAALRRLTSLDETVVFDTAFAWLARTPATEIVLLLVPLIAAAVLLAQAFRRERGLRRTEAALLAGLLLLAFFKVRWGVIAAVMALPLLWPLVPSRRIAVVAAGVFLAGLLGWGVTRPPRAGGPEAADLTVLIHRHFAHWLASHHPGQPVAVLAPPELSDALVFHGGVRVLMSTAWEAHAGQVAASRILSAPEASEAEAVLQGRQITHVVLTSWDPVLPLLVKPPETGKDTLYARLQRWVLPRTLRPVPYQLPGVPGYADQKLAVFKVTPPQDEALALSRLAEYFAEMERREPAQLAAKVLAQSFADDPNARLARALVAAQTGDRAGFERELARFAADAEAGRVPFGWDRRVQRAILLALGRRPEIAKAEAAACLAEASAETLFELTPLQAYRLGALARNFGLGFPSPELEALTAALGAEYHAARPGR